MSCREHTELASDLLDGRLSRRLTRRARVHRVHCPGCSALLSQLQAVLAACACLVPDPVGPDVLARLLALYHLERT